jgi:hypothetical protein
VVGLPQSFPPLSRQESDRLERRANGYGAVERGPPRPVLVVEEGRVPFDDVLKGLERLVLGNGLEQTVPSAHSDENLLQGECPAAAPRQTR